MWSGALCDITKGQFPEIPPCFQPADRRLKEETFQFSDRKKEDIIRKHRPHGTFKRAKSGFLVSSEASSEPHRAPSVGNT